MKYLIKIVIMSLALLFVGTQAFSQEVYAVSDESLQTDFDKLKTYNWASHATSDDPRFTLNELAIKERIRNAIEEELEAKGYQKENYDPDMIVNFRLFDKKSDLSGYEDVYGDESFWKYSEMQKDLVGISPESNSMDRAEMKVYRFNQGTLLIDIVETETYTRIWTGYVSGVDDKYNLDRKSAGIQKVVDKLFSEFEYSALGDDS